MEPGFLNGRNHYTIIDDDGNKGRFALWFAQDTWFLGKTEERGQHKGFMHSGFKTDQCVHDIGYTWRYYDNSNRQWVNAEQGLKAWCHN